MNNDINHFYCLHSLGSSIVIDCRQGTPCILYWGSLLGEHTTPQMLALLMTRQEPKAREEKEPPLSLSPEFSRGFLGNAGIQVHRRGRAWDLHTQLIDVKHNTENNSLCFTSKCDAHKVEVIHSLSLDHHSDVLQATTKIVNRHQEALQVEQCNAPTIPMPLHYDKIRAFEGRWANEFQLQSVDRYLGTYLRENRTGRTSHDSFPGVVIHTGQTNESHGSAYGLHLGWSGNHRLQIEELSEGRAYAQLGELFYPGEIDLEENQSYTSPTLFGAQSQQGFTGLSACFHKFVRSHLIDSRLSGKPKPIHFNTWEAMYFDIKLDRLRELVDQAAEVGVERFVLDDGWFKGRNGDSAGLGDWFIDQEKFPDGLTPLIEYVHSKGMEFGIWLEPEMVNPDSDLFRAHPSWVLGANSAEPLMFRNQLVLDLTRAEVQAYLFERIDELLTENDIAYIKWDMNRNISQPGGSNGRVVAHYQTLAVYDLLKKIRRAHPLVEIESCSSGGGRADYGILEHTDRIWTSDSNDAIDRLRIQKGFSYFFPPELMGAHVGPHECHITGRKISMATRAGVAMFGSMGIEANLLEITDDEKEQLKAAVSLFKKHRALILGGDLIRSDMPEYENGFGVISQDKKQAIFSYALLEGQPNDSPGRFRFRGLAADASYRVSMIWPIEPYYYSDSILNVIDGAVLSGDALERVGMQLPILLPESVLIMHIKMVE